ncbi:MAG: heme A synthase [Hyphomonadaceae bacterium]|nr:heme A synthase [Hyphomonadaceae bacterium]OUX95739.1 MAG: heme A synthase [Hyphomonas sp. TMED17]CAI8357216.1 MAG: Heme A synthase [Hyphomonas sp. TMED17]
MTTTTMTPTAAGWIRFWLITLAIMVYAMILIGGATRLTDSGLSITEWAPIKGTLPPIGEAAWLVAFEKYAQTAEYQQQNYQMSMSEFQYIYWWEWGHRLFGRLIGVVAIAGFVIFLVRRWLTRTWIIRCGVLIALGGLQGVIGWWMVASGIGDTERVDVAPYRLMTHFGLALFIIALIAWFWSDLRDQEKFTVDRPVRIGAYVLLGLIFLQMLTGALVAGLDAGRTYTDWPLMAGELVPQSYWQREMGARSLFEGRAATQFNHRLLAYVLWGAAIGFAIWQRRSMIGTLAISLAVLVSLQAIWGILTLLSVAPIGMALVHQGLGVIVLLFATRLAWRLSR